MEFDNFHSTHSSENKKLVEEIFNALKNHPLTNIENEYFPYNILDNKIDMENVMPCMA